MQSANVHLALLTASDAPRMTSSAAQAEFSKLRALLRARGVPTSTPMFYRDGDPNAGGFTGEYVVPLLRATEPTMGTFLVAWRHARSRRKGRLRGGDAKSEERAGEGERAFLWRVLDVSQAPRPV